MMNSTSVCADRADESGSRRESSRPIRREPRLPPFVGAILTSLALIAAGAALGLPVLAIATGAALAAGLSVYFLACVAAALPFARSLDPVALVILPGVIAVYHFAYGLGFLCGILKLARRESGAVAPARFFTALTR